jgi:hypothetical protein
MKSSSSCLKANRQIYYVINPSLRPQRALRSLSRVDVVGVAEHYDASVCLALLKLQGLEYGDATGSDTVPSRYAQKIAALCRCEGSPLPRMNKQRVEVWLDMIYATTAPLLKAFLVRKEISLSRLEEFCRD